jgi:hypothetical protein
MRIGGRSPLSRSFATVQPLLTRVEASRLLSAKEGFGASFLFIVRVTDAGFDGTFFLTTAF